MIAMVLQAHDWACVLAFVPTCHSSGLSDLVDLWCSVPLQCLSLDVAEDVQSSLERQQLEMNADSADAFFFC